MKRVFLTLLLVICINQISISAPVISTVSDTTPDNNQAITITGTDFGAETTIVSWDDFEAHSDGTNIYNTPAIIGPNWTCIYSYNGDGAEYDNYRSHSGNISAKIEWGVAPSNTIRAFGWVNQGPFNELYITYWRYMTGNFTTACNHKQYFLYGNNGEMPQGLNLIPMGNQNWGYYNQVGDPAVPYCVRYNCNTAGWVYSNTSNVFQRWEVYTLLNDPPSASNGIIREWLNGVQGINTTDWRGRYDTGEYIDFRLGHMAQGFTASAIAWFDDLYIATTQARIEIGNNSSFSSCTHREIQPSSSWSGSSATFNFRTGTFGSGNTVYIFLVDEDGVASNGYAVTIGGADTTPPTLQSSTISSNGTTLTLVFDESVTQGSGYNDSDLDIDCVSGGNNISISYSSGNASTTHIYTISQTIYQGDTCNLDFNGDSNSLEDNASNDLAAISNGSVTNNSTQSLDVTSPTIQSAVISANGTTLTITYDEFVSQGVGYNDSDFDVDCTEGGTDIALTYSSGDGTATHIYTLANLIYLADVCNLDFNGDANSIEDGSSNDLAAVVNGSITNNSAQVQAASFSGCSASGASFN